MNQILYLLFYLLIFCGVLAILWWGFRQIAPTGLAGLPFPVRVILIIFICIVCIAVLLWLVGGVGGGMGSLPFKK